MIYYSLASDNSTLCRHSATYATVL